MLMPRREVARGLPEAVAAGGVAPTPILDWQASGIGELAASVADEDPRESLRRAHAAIQVRVRPVYGLDDERPASLTLRSGRGSCSQRLALLEAVARALGVATRVQGLLVDGRFWYPRFPRLRWAVPETVVLAWPEFRLEGGWVPVSELFEPPSPTGATGFANAGAETLFDAVRTTVVDWDGRARARTGCAVCDLSGQVADDLGYFDSRDELFAANGQTMSAVARWLLGPAMGRWAAGAGGATEGRLSGR
jgi:hypothetical protein